MGADYLLKHGFTSDTHFGHANIIKYCDRPFKDIDRMDEVLIKNWNARVKENDLVIFLGDFCFRGDLRAEDYLHRLNGHITFIKGNHDYKNSLNTRILSLLLNISGLTVYCTHNPKNFRSKYSINLVGHVHEKWKIQKRGRNKKVLLINVGVDQWDYHPIDINEILKAIYKFKDEESKK